MFDRLLGEGLLPSILEITFTLIVVYLVLSRSDGFSDAIDSVSGAYTRSVKVLQGR